MYCTYNFVSLVTLGLMYCQFVLLRWLEDIYENTSNLSHVQKW